MLHEVPTEEVAVSKLEAWFPDAAASGRSHLTVPKKVQELPCGCKREGSKPLVIHVVPGGWGHYSHTCDAVFRLPPVGEKRPRRPKKNMNTKSERLRDWLFPT